MTPVQVMALGVPGAPPDATFARRAGLDAVRTWWLDHDDVRWMGCRARPRDEDRAGGRGHDARRGRAHEHVLDGRWLVNPHDDGVRRDVRGKLRDLPRRV